MTAPHYYEIVADGQKFLAGCHAGMAEVLKYPSVDAPEDSEKTSVFKGTQRAYQAWICRLIAANKTGEFLYQRRQATATAAAMEHPPAPPDPPKHIEAEIDPETGTVDQSTLTNFDLPQDGTYTVVIRTPGGPPNKSIRETLKGHHFFWNPNDGRGNAEWPMPAWLRHHVAGDALPALRRLCQEHHLEFDYLDRNPVAK